MIEAGLYTLLTENAGLAALVGLRVFPQVLPPSVALPALTYQAIAGRSTQGLATRGPQRWLYQFDCWGKTYLAAAGVRYALIQALDRQVAKFADGTVLLGAFFHQPLDGFGSQNELYRLGAEFYLYFNFPAN